MKQRFGPKREGDIIYLSKTQGRPSKFRGTSILKLSTIKEKLDKTL
jgi:hypothetical protein